MIGATLPIIATLIVLAQAAVAPGPPAAAPGPAPLPAPGPLSQTDGDAWVRRGSAELRALDKVNARTKTLIVPVGQQAHFGSLTITVQGCYVRPVDAVPDAAAFLDITDAHQVGAGFDGWMFAAEPALGVLENPVYDIRLAACRP